MNIPHEISKNITNSSNCFAVSNKNKLSQESPLSIWVAQSPVMILWIVAKSCTWDGRKPINNGMFTTYYLAQDFATIQDVPMRCQGAQRSARPSPRAKQQQRHWPNLAWFQGTNMVILWMVAKSFKKNGDSDLGFLWNTVNNGTIRR